MCAFFGFRHCAASQGDPCRLAAGPPHDAAICSLPPASSASYRLNRTRERGVAGSKWRLPRFVVLAPSPRSPAALRASREIQVVAVLATLSHIGPAVGGRLSVMRLRQLRPCLPADETRSQQRWSPSQWAPQVGLLSPPCPPCQIVEQMFVAWQSVAG